MQSGICNLNLIPVRKLADHTSEMITQLLFGETFDILKQEGSWVQVQLHYDSYIGWIQHRQYLAFDKSEIDSINAKPKVLISDLLSSVTEKSTGNTFALLMGSTISISSANQFNFADEIYTFNGHYLEPVPEKETIIKYAEKYLGSPYLWGGRTHFGIDCSGFTQMVYKLAGYSLPRDASQQAILGETLSFLAEAESGDLLFFDNPEGDIVHVGMLYDANKIIHASGNVRIDTIDHQGIYNDELQKYTHQLRLIKKMV
ncbi:MAG: C40 family peptidase [Bacteroidetes bacterium]|nr:C40 family peptidase [Bacteroidota bacterium]